MHCYTQNGYNNNKKKPQTIDNLSKRNEAMCLHEDMYANVRRSIIYNSQKVETTQMFINWWTDRQNMVYPYNRILSNNKKEQDADRDYNMDKPQKHYARWKKPDTKEHILYDYMIFPEKAKN